MAHTNRITSDSVVDLIFHLKWKSNVAVHTDGYQASRVNIWRDLLPPMLMDALMNEDGERLQVPLEAGVAISAFSPLNLLDIKNTQFDRRFRQGTAIDRPWVAFIPRECCRESPEYSGPTSSPSGVGLNNGHMTVDFNPAGRQGP